MSDHSGPPCYPKLYPPCCPRFAVTNTSNYIISLYYQYKMVLGNEKGHELPTVCIQICALAGNPFKSLAVWSGKRVNGPGIKGTLGISSNYFPCQKFITSND